MWGEQIRELADILLDTFAPDKKIPDYAFSIQNLRIKDLFGSQPLPETDPTVKSIRIGGSYKSGAFLEYEVTAEFRGETTELDYYKNNLYPLLKQYDEKQDHTEIFKHLAYLDYQWDKTGFNIPCFRPSNAPLSHLKEIFSHSECYCYIKSDETLDDLRTILGKNDPANLEQNLRRINQIRIFSRFGESPVYTGFKEGPIFDRQVIDLYFKNRPKIKSRAHEMVIDFNVPFYVEAA